MASHTASKSSRGRELKRSQKALEADHDSDSNSPPPNKKARTSKTKTGAAVAAAAAAVAPKPRKQNVLVEDDDDEDSDLEILGEPPRKRDRVIETPHDDDWDDSPPPPSSRHASTSSSRASIRVDDSENEDEPHPAPSKSKDKGKAPAAPEAPEEDPVAQLERLKKRWTSGTYALFEPTPIIEYNAKGQRVHKFKCAARPCKGKGRNGCFVIRNLETADKTSTKLLIAHAEGCWGKAVVEAARNAKSADDLRPLLENKTWDLKDGSIIAAFKRLKKETVTYSHVMEEKPEARGSHVRWVAESLRPFNIVKDAGYNHLMKTGRNAQFVPSVTTLKRDTRKVFAACRQKIADLLRSRDGALHFATDAWTSPNHRALMAVTVSYEEKGVMVTYLLDIVEVPYSHSGKNLAKAFKEIIDEFDVCEKVLAVVCDNATNNDTLLGSLDEILALFDSEHSRVRCFCHIVNLVAKSVLSQFDVPKRKKKAKKSKKAKKPKKAPAKKKTASDTTPSEPMDVDEAEANVDEAVEGGEGDGDGQVEAVDEVDVAGPKEIEIPETAELREIQELAEGEEVEEQDAIKEDKMKGNEKDNDDGWVDERAEMSNEELKDLEQKVMPARRVLTKVRKIAYAVKNSTTILLPRWKKLCEIYGKTARIIPRDVSTRWNSSHDMLEFAVEYKDVIDALTNERTSNLDKYELSKQEWELADQLVDVLAIFKIATSFFSQKNKSLLSSVIPAMDGMQDDLDELISDPDTPAGIVSALKLGKATLGRYYEKTDLSTTYRIAMILDPRRKLSYFRDADWPAAWVARAEKVFRDRFEEKYASLEVETPLAETTPTPNPTPTASDPSKKKKRESRLAQALRNAQPEGSSSSPSAADEIARYLNMETASLGTKPLEWWMENRTKFPRLSRMGLDYMSIPSTSVDVERVFSKGRIVVPHLRNRLETETLRSILCLHDWYNSHVITLKDMQKALRGYAVAEPNAEDNEELEEGWAKVK